jgi:hypothetical protein
MQVEVLVPTSLREVKLSQYQKYAKLETDENSNTPFLLQKMLEIFCNIDLKDVASVKYKDLLGVTTDLKLMLNKEYKLVKRFKLDDVQYGFVPLLEDISLGEFIDLDTNLANWETMHKAMSVLYRPIVDKKGDRYSIEEYKGTNDKLKEMPLDIVFGAVVFFYHLSQELLKATLNYLAVGETLDLDQQTVLEKNGDGINQSMHLLRETLQNLNISLS